MTIPTFSFIIPVKPGGHVAALEALRQLDDSQPFEVLVSEGCNPSRQRNTAANEARGDILYFLDDDSTVASDCRKSCTAIMTDTSVAVVGGPSLTPHSDSRMQQLFGLALASLFGAGSMRNRYRSVGTTRETTDRELILCNLAIRRDTFLEAGGLDERLYPNEENELLDRILASGKKLMHAPHMAVQRSQRRSLRLFIRQMFSYGRGRAQQTLIAGSGPLTGFIPLGFLVYLLLLPFAASHQVFFYPLYLYAFLALASTLTAIATSCSITAAFLAFLFPVMHISNGTGLLYGFIKGENGVAAAEKDQNIVVRKLKYFEQLDW